MKKAVVWQMKAICSRKAPIGMFLFLYAYVLLNYLTNVFRFNGTDVTDMYMSMYLMVLSQENASFHFFFMQYFPLLLVIPASFSFLQDKSSRALNYLAARMGRRRYYVSKGIAVFLISFAVFTLPFLLEILLNCIAFPLDAVGHVSNINNYEKMESFERMFLVKLFCYSPYLYAVLFTFIFGIVTGVLSVFALGISMLKMRFKVFVFLPCYLLLYASYFGNRIPGLNGTDTNYFIYFSIFDDAPKNGVGYFLVVLLVALVPAVIIHEKGKRDCLC